MVLGNSEQNQFNSELALTARIKLSELTGLQGGYAVAYYDTMSRSVGVLSSPSSETTELQDMLGNLAATRRWQAFRADNPAGQLFSDRAAGRAGPDRDLAAGHRRRSGAQ